MNRKPDLRVAVVGAGPAGLYAAACLIEQRDLLIEVDIFDALPVPWGLVRSGVAPDHPEKKLIIDRFFDFVLKHRQVRFIGNVTIGQDISHDELSRRYEAVLYSVGATGDVHLNLPGESLPGSWSARQFVSYYNGHPDFTDLEFDLSTKRAIIVGNGNVALDVARVLTRDPRILRRTDIADNALAKLEKSRIEEVVVLGRRDPLQAAYNCPELEEFLHIPEVDVSVRGIRPGDLLQPAASADALGRRKAEILRRLVSRPRRDGNRRLVFQFHTVPVAIEGNGKVEALTMLSKRVDAADADAAPSRLETGLVLRAIGYRGMAFPGLPFDPVRGVIANREGRVVDDGRALAGVYVSGWIKRGCRGVIGSNKKCARESVGHLLADFAAGLLRPVATGSDTARDFIVRGAPHAVFLNHWLRIDRAERLAGNAQARPRVKIARRHDLLSIAFDSADADPPIVNQEVAKCASAQELAQ